MDKNIYELRLFEGTKVNCYMLDKSESPATLFNGYVVRVPGGWLFFKEVSFTATIPTGTDNGVFIPFTNDKNPEFKTP